MRNYGVTARPASGGQPPAGPHYGADTTRADPSLDLETGALLFSIAAFTCPFVLVGFAITAWLLFFE